MEVETPLTRPLAMLASVAGALLSTADTTTRLHQLNQLTQAVGILLGQVRFSLLRIPMTHEANIVDIFIKYLFKK